MLVALLTRFTPTCVRFVPTPPRGHWPSQHVASLHPGICPSQRSALLRLALLHLGRWPRQLVALLQIGIWPSLHLAMSQLGTGVVVCSHCCISAFGLGSILQGAISASAVGCVPPRCSSHCCFSAGNFISLSHRCISASGPCGSRSAASQHPAGQYLGIWP